MANGGVQRGGVDLGWLFMLPGVVLIAAALLIAAQDDLNEARYRRDQALAIERRHAERVDHYRSYLAALERENPAVVRSLVVGQLNQTPVDAVEARVPGTPVYDNTDVFASLEPGEPEAVERVRIDSVLSRWATDDSKRVWLLASGALCVFVGLLPPVSRRAGAGRAALMIPAGDGPDGEVDEVEDADAQDASAEDEGGDGEAWDEAEASGDAEEESEEDDEEGDDEDDEEDEDEDGEGENGEDDGDWEEEESDEDEEGEEEEGDSEDDGDDDAEEDDAEDGDDEEGADENEEEWEDEESEEDEGEDEGDDGGEDDGEEDEEVDGEEDDQNDAGVTSRSRGSRTNPASTPGLFG